MYYTGSQNFTQHTSFLRILATAITWYTIVIMSDTSTLKGEKKANLSLVSCSYVHEHLGKLNFMEPLKRLHPQPDKRVEKQKANILSTKQNFGY